MALSSEQRALIALKKLAGKSQTDQDNIVSGEGLPGGISTSYQTIFANAIPGTPLSGSEHLVDGGSNDDVLPLGTNQTALSTSFNTDETGVVMYVRLPLVKIAATDDGVGWTGWVAKLPNTTESEAGAGDGASGKDFVTLSQAGANYSKVSSRLEDATKGFTNGATIAETAGKIQFVPPSFGTANSDNVNPYDVRLWKHSRYTDVQAGTDRGVWTNPTQEMNWFFDYFSGVLFIGDTSHDTYDVDSNHQFYIEGCLYVGSYLIDKDTSDPAAPGEIAKQKLFNAYTFNKTATFLEYSGSSFSNDQPSSYWELPTSCILGSEMIHVNGLLQDSSSRGIGADSGEVNDYLIYKTGSNFMSSSNDKTVIEFSYRALDGNINPHHNAKVKVTYLQKDE